MASHPQYADAAPYVGKFRALQQRAMGSIRTRVQGVLKQAVEQARHTTHTKTRACSSWGIFMAAAGRSCLSSFS
jgi:hypothetical protein